MRILDCRAGVNDRDPVRKMVLKPARVDHEFLRHAASDHACPADAEFFRDHDLGSMGRRDSRGAHAARSRADHEEIDIVAGHSTTSHGREHNRFSHNRCAASPSH